MERLSFARAPQLCVALFCERVCAEPHIGRHVSRCTYIHTWVTSDVASLLMPLVVSKEKCPVSRLCPDNHRFGLIQVRTGNYRKPNYYEAEPVIKIVFMFRRFPILRRTHSPWRRWQTNFSDRRRGRSVGNKVSAVMAPRQNLLTFLK